MPQRISPAKLQRLLSSLQALICAVHDARQRYSSCRQLSARRLSGLSRFTKELLGLPHSSNYASFEIQLKRRLVKVQHRLHGRQGAGVGDCYALRDQLPNVYQDAVLCYDDAARELLRSLVDVDIHANHQPLKSVRELL